MFGNREDLLQDFLKKIRCFWCSGCSGTEKDASFSFTDAIKRFVVTVVCLTHCQ